MHNSWSGVSADGLHPRPLYPMRAIRGGDDESIAERIFPRPPQTHL
jgi:hypothetical protein